MRFNILESKAEDSKINRTLAYNSKEARIMVFDMPANTQVPPYTSPSRVILYCAKGTGEFLKDKEWIPVKEGDMLACEPLEPHGMKTDSYMKVLAIIAPAPGLKVVE